MRQSWTCWSSWLYLGFGKLTGGFCGMLCGFLYFLPASTKLFIELVHTYCLSFWGQPPPAPGQWRRAPCVERSVSVSSSYFDEKWTGRVIELQKVLLLLCCADSCLSISLLSAEASFALNSPTSPYIGMYVDKDLAIRMLYRFLFIDLAFYRFSYQFPNRLKNK